MRATGRLCALLCALLALLPTSLAQAKITPLPKPAGLAAKPAAVRGTSLIAPVSRPATPTTVAPVRHQVASPRTTTVRRTTRTSRHGFVPAASRGGRERAWRALTSGGRAAPPLAGLAPTPLGLVGAGEALPADAYAWPPWKVAVLTLLAVAEGFVLVRLARHGRFARASERI
ncbi:MAG: hypothetical protein M3Q31_24550 [Actinomycetota bacterium]|nr:hypothetical protein [Actinomycetota bacterium]